MSTFWVKLWMFRKTQKSFHYVCRWWWSLALLLPLTCMSTCDTRVCLWHSNTDTSGLALDIFKMESWNHLRCTANILTQETSFIFLHPSAKTCIFCWWDGIIASSALQMQFIEINKDVYNRRDIDTSENDLSTMMPPQLGSVGKKRWDILDS